MGRGIGKEGGDKGLAANTYPNDEYNSNCYIVRYNRKHQTIAPYKYSSSIRKKEADELHEQGALPHFMNGWCANHSGRRLCEK